MSTRVERSSSLTSRTVQGGLGDVKSQRTNFSPLSDASNKSTESSLTGSVLIEETNTTPNKYFSKYNTGTRPRISPKPFSREATPETQNLSISAPKSPLELKLSYGVPPQTSSNISLSDSGKKDDDGRQTRFFRPSLQPNSEKERGTNPEKDPYIGRKLYSSTWAPATKSEEEESRPTAHLEEWNLNTKHDASVKPQVTSTQFEHSQTKDTFHASVYKINFPDEKPEPKGISTEEEPKISLISKNEDPTSLRAQLRPKRRPVSAMFLNPVNDSSTDNQVAKDEKPVLRKPRPLSVDLTSKFENRDSSVVKKINSSEEVKENIPLRKPSFNASILEEKAEFGDQERSATTKTNSGGTSGNTYSPFPDKDTTYNYGWGKKNNREQMDSVSGEYPHARKMEENCNQTARPLTHDDPFFSDNSVPRKSDSNISESAIAPGTLQNRISLLKANRNVPGEATESSTAKEGKGSPVVQRRPKALPSDNIEYGTPWTSLPSQLLPSDTTKIYSSSPPIDEFRYEKSVETPTTSVSKDYANLKDNLSQKTKSEAVEENLTWAPKSSRPVEEKIDDSHTTFRGRTKFISTDKIYNSTAGITEGKDRNNSADIPLKTVRATMFEHNVERHSTASVYTKPYPPIKSEMASEFVGGKRDYHSRSDHFDGGLTPKRPNVKDYTESEIWMSDRQGGKAASFTESMNRRDFQENVDCHVPNSLKNAPDNLSLHRIEITQTIGERALSESINIAPGDKAVTLRAQRSFHNKPRDADGNAFDDGSFDRPYSKLQRSKSEYRKPSTGNISDSPINKPWSREFDAYLEKKHSFKSERSVLMKPQADVKIERTYQANKIKTAGTDVYGQEKFDYSSSYKPQEKFNFESVEDDRERPNVLTSDSKTWEPNKLYKGPTDDRKSTEKDGSAKFWQPSLSTTVKDPGSGRKTVKEDTSDCLNSMLSKEIEKVKQELTPDRTSSKDTVFFKANEKFLETSTSDDKWSKGRTFLDTGSIKADHENIPNVTRDIFMDVREAKGNVNRGFQYESKDHVSKPTLMETSSSDQKATYFALTCLDNRKEKDEKDFENYRTITSFINEDPVTTNTKVANPYADNITPERYLPREDFDKSSASKYKKTARNQNVVQEDFYAKSNEKSSEISITNAIDVIKKSKDSSRPEDQVPLYGESYITSTVRDCSEGHRNTDIGQKDITHHEPKATYKPKPVDLDALMKDYHQKIVVQEDFYAKSNEKSSEISTTNAIDVIKKSKDSSRPQDKVPLYGESYITSTVRDCSEGHQNTDVGQKDITHHEPKATYKPKLVDLDALMKDYQKIGNAKETKTSDGFEGEDQRFKRSERSRSFKYSSEQVPKSKWVGPSMSGIDAGEGYQNKPLASWPSSQEASSGRDQKDDVKVNYRKESEIYSPEQNSGKRIGNTMEKKNIPSDAEKSQNVLTVDSFLARQTPRERRSPSRVAQTPSDVVFGRSSTRYTSTTSNVSEMSVDNQGTHFYSQTEWKYSSVEQKPSRTERGPAKASDIVGSMLEGRAKSRRPQHSKQSVPVESFEQPKSQTSSSQKDCMSSDYKEYTQRGISRQRPKSLHESELRREKRIHSQNREISAEQPQGYLNIRSNSW
uniref:Uncharacterized protein n=1 Tax=Leptobrachium leishanense TaxID=445787 RepID=A0A8C5LVD2_9ANUR